MVEAWQQAMEQQVDQGRLSETMKRSYEWGFAQYLDWLNHQAAGPTTPELITHWIRSLEEQGYNSFSVSFWLDSVKSFYSWAYEEGWIPRDPTIGTEANARG